MPRKTKYTRNFPKRAFQLAKKGLYDYQIAKSLNINTATFYNYMNVYSEFSEAIKEGREESTQELENEMYKRAIGYHYEEEHTEIVSDQNGNAKVKSKRKVKKFIYSDTAGIFLLKARKPEKYRERHHVEVEEGLTAKDKKEIYKKALIDKTEEELKRLLKENESKQ